MDRKRAHFMFVCIYVCRFFEDFSRLLALTEPKVLLYGRVVDNTLIGHVLAQWFSQRERSARS